MTLDLFFGFHKRYIMWIRVPLSLNYNLFFSTILTTRHQFDIVYRFSCYTVITKLTLTYNVLQ